MLSGSSVGKRRCFASAAMPSADVDVEKVRPREADGSEHRRHPAGKSPSRTISFTAISARHGSGDAW